MQDTHPVCCAAAQQSAVVERLRLHGPAARQHVEYDGNSLREVVALVPARHGDLHVVLACTETLVN